MCSTADAGISTKSAPQGFCCACSPAKSEVLFSADVCVSVKSWARDNSHACCPEKRARSVQKYMTLGCAQTLGNVRRGA